MPALIKQLGAECEQLDFDVLIYSPAVIGNGSYFDIYCDMFDDKYDVYRCFQPG